MIKKLCESEKMSHPEKLKNFFFDHFGLNSSESENVSLVWKYLSLFAKKIDQIWVIFCPILIIFLPLLSEMTIFRLKSGWKLRSNPKLRLKYPPFIIVKFIGPFYALGFDFQWKTQWTTFLSQWNCLGMYNYYAKKMLP